MDARQSETSKVADGRMPAEASDRRPSVLLLEPDRPIRTLVAEWLEMAGYGCIDGREIGPASAAAARCEVALIDVRAPLQTARQTIASVASVTPHAAIIAMSADALASGKLVMEAAARELGVAAVLVKPFDRGALLQALERARART